MQVNLSFPWKRGICKCKNAQSACKKTCIIKSILILARSFTVELSGTWKVKICLWQHFLSTLYETCRDIKLLNFGIFFAGRKHGHRHLNGHKQAVAPQVHYIEIKQYQVGKRYIWHKCMIHFFSVLIVMHEFQSYQWGLYWKKLLILDTTDKDRIVRTFLFFVLLHFLLNFKSNFSKYHDGRIKVSP